MSTENKNVVARFWYQTLYFLNAYYGYFFSIRSGNYNLRNASLPALTELFFAYSHVINTILTNCLPLLYPAVSYRATGRPCCIRLSHTDPLSVTVVLDCQLLTHRLSLLFSTDTGCSCCTRLSATDSLTFPVVLDCPCSTRLSATDPLTFPVVLDCPCSGRSSLTNEKDHHYFLNRFVCVGEFFDGWLGQF